jgi:putative nucleotidyltransferase with HDIG domain
VNQVPYEVRNAFGLNVESDVPDTTGLQSNSNQQNSNLNQQNNPGLKTDLDVDLEFEQLKNVIENSPLETAEGKLVELRKEFSLLIAPILKTGTVDPDDLERLKLSIVSKIGVIDDEKLATDQASANRNISWQEIKLSNLRLGDLLSDSGLIGQQWKNYPRLEPVRVQLETWLRTQVKPNLKYTQVATQAARNQTENKVPDQYEQVNAGDVIVFPGENINSPALAKLWQEYSTQSQLNGLSHRITRLGMSLVLLSILVILNAYLLSMYQVRILQNLVSLSGYIMVLVLGTFVSRIISFDPFRAEMVPVIVAVMVYAIAYGQHLACVMAVCFSLLVTLTTRIDAEQFASLLGATLAAVSTLRKIQSRARIMLAGFYAAIAFFIISYGMTVLEASSPYLIVSNTDYLLFSVRGALWCFIAGFLVTGGLPIIEGMFGVVTGISLLELGNPSHPLLRELVQRAPGTYNHSISVASIAETAAINIGANGLLVRIGAYFHDIGKIPKAEYFVENSQAGATSRHQNLAPAMSTLIIIGHVKDGIDLAEQYNLPRPLMDFIEQHHGTTLVEYFYHQATEKAEQKPDYEAPVEESSFRYPGPKPLSRETGVMMLADAVESACRALKEPTPKRIERLVHDLTLKRLLDGQFDESGLTLNEIRIIEKSLIKSLTAIHHARIAYPEQRNAS